MLIYFQVIEYFLDRKYMYKRIENFKKNDWIQSLNISGIQVCYIYGKTWGF